MKNDKIIFINLIPKFFAITFSMMIFTYLISIFFFERLLLKESSTSSIIIVLIPIYMFIFSCIGYIIGFLLKKIVFKNFNRQIDKSKLKMNFYISVIIINVLVIPIAYYTVKLF